MPNLHKKSKTVSKLKVEDGFQYNPWSVEDASVFLKYCCPECDYQVLNYDIFSAHALENHIKSIVLFQDNQNLMIKQEVLNYDEENFDPLCKKMFLKDN
jgi:hypothetical protein